MHLCLAVECIASSLHFCCFSINLINLIRSPPPRLQLYPDVGFRFASTGKTARSAHNNNISTAHPTSLLFQLTSDRTQLSVSAIETQLWGGGGYESSFSWLKEAELGSFCHLVQCMHQKRTLRQSETIRANTTPLDTRSHAHTNTRRTSQNNV